MNEADPIDWRSEARTAGLVAVFAALSGSVVGIVWHAVAPKIHIVAATEGSEAAMKPLIGDDLWLGLLGAIAGVVCVLVLTLAAPKQARGPGALLGLAVGGLLGMLVAARVGHLIGHHDLIQAIRAGFPAGGNRLVRVVLSYFDFKVRATAVLLTWPIASVVVSAVTTWVQAVRQPATVVNGTPNPPLSPYPGSP